MILMDLYSNTNHRIHEKSGKRLAARNLQGMIQNVPWCRNVDAVLNSHRFGFVRITGEEKVQPLLGNDRIIKFYFFNIIGILCILIIRNTVNLRLTLLVCMLNEVYF